MNPKTSGVFSPASMGYLKLRNRLIRAGCFEGMCQEGRVTPALIEHHRRVAAGGIAMTTLAYVSVTYDGRAFEHELWMRPDILPGLRQLTGSVHQEGAAASIQLGHCGYFASSSVIGGRPKGASPKFNLFRFSYCSQMTHQQIDEMIMAFGRAALMARDAGFDAVEIHAGHGYLLSQFLSPYTNHRKDQYGGSLENRMRFPVAVIRYVRELLGDTFPILVKMNLSDGMKEGLLIDDAIEVARRFETAGATALVPSGGFTSKTPFYMLRGNLPVREMVRNQHNLFRKTGLMLFGRFMVREYPFEPMFLLEGARQIKEAVKIPVVYLGGVMTAGDMAMLLEEGFGFVALGRATIRDPDFPNKIGRGEVTESDCDHCNRCVAAMDGGGVYCVTEKEESVAGPKP